MLLHPNPLGVYDVSLWGSPLSDWTLDMRLTASIGDSSKQWLAQGGRLERMASTTGVQCAAYGSAARRSAPRWFEFFESVPATASRANRSATGVLEAASRQGHARLRHLEIRHLEIRHLDVSPRSSSVGSALIQRVPLVRHRRPIGARALVPFTSGAELGACHAPELVGIALEAGADHSCQRAARHAFARP
jgi:hypothetical protein